MEGKVILQSEELEQVSGGEGIEGIFYFKTAMFRGGALLEVIRCSGVPGAPGNCIKISASRKYNVSMECIHVYLPSGDEMRYDGSFGESGVRDGDMLKMIIME